MRPGVNILVGIDAALDTATGIVTWKFTTLDPATHQFPEDPEDGFLPPNVTSPEGEGEMLFTVSLKPGLGLGTTVCNDASIVFDFNPPIVTNDFCNTIGEPVPPPRLRELLRRRRRQPRRPRRSRAAAPTAARRWRCARAR